MGWRYDRNTMKRLVDEDRIIFPDTPDGRPRRKVFLSDVKEVRPGFSSVIGTDIYTRTGTSDIVSVFGNRVFDFPKPVELLIQLLEQTTDDNSIVLDFFAGSGTTAHAVLELNKRDSGHRRFIVCTNNENGICENVTYPRVKTVITGKRTDGSDYAEGIAANIKYYRTAFVSKDEEYLSDALLEHIAEMVQLEHGVKIDGSQYLMVMSDDEADELQAHWNEYEDVKALYVSRNVLFTTEQNRLFANAEIHIIPDYYFNFELKEVGETW